MTEANVAEADMVGAKMAEARIEDSLVKVVGILAGTFCLTLITIAFTSGSEGINLFFTAHIPAVVDSIFEKIDLIFFTYRIFYVILMVAVVYFALGWWFLREDMKDMTTLFVRECYFVAGTIREGVAEVWKVISNPWTLICYGLIILWLRRKTDEWVEMTKEAEKMRQD